MNAFERLDYFAYQVHFGHIDPDGGVPANIRELAASIDHDVRDNETAEAFADRWRCA